MAEEVKVKIVADADGAIKSVEAAGDAFEELEDAQDEATASAERQADAQKEAANAAEQGADAQKDLATASEQSADAQNDTKQAAERAANAQREAASAAEKQADAQRQVSSTGGTANEILFSTGDAIQDAQFGFAGAANNIAADEFSTIAAPFFSKFIDNVIKGRASGSFDSFTNLLEDGSEQGENFRRVLRDAGVEVDELATDNIPKLRDQIREQEEAFRDAASMIDEKSAAEILGSSPSALADAIEEQLNELVRIGTTKFTFPQLFEGTEEELRQENLEQQIKLIDDALSAIVKKKPGISLADDAFKGLNKRVKRLRKRLRALQQETGDDVDTLGIPEPPVVEVETKVLEPEVPEFDEVLELPPLPLEQAQTVLKSGLDQSVQTVDGALKNLGSSFVAATGQERRQELLKMIRRLKQLKGEMRGVKEEGDSFSSVMDEVGQVGKEALQDALVGGFVQLGKAIGQGQNALKAFGQAAAGILASIAQAIGKQLIAIGSSMIFTNPAAGAAYIAAGSAIIAAATALQGLASGGGGGGGGGGGSDAGAQGTDRPEGGGEGGVTVEGRAEGGPVSQGTPYMVGEEGPELFVPRASGKIVPNALGSASRRRGMRVQQQTDVSVDVTEPELFDLTARINESQRILDRVARQ